MIWPSQRKINTMTFFQINHLTLIHFTRSHQSIISHHFFNAVLCDPWVSRFKILWSWWFATNWNSAPWWSADKSNSVFKIIIVGHKPYPWHMIGTCYVQRPGMYYWSDGWHVLYTKWAHDQPSRPEGGGCVHMDEEGLWTDSACNTHKYFMCKIHTSGELKVNSQNLIKWFRCSKQSFIMVICIWPI